MNYKEKLKDIKAFVFDVDGVFTDDTVYLLPGENMCRAMSSLDGYAVIKALKQGYKVGIITGGSDPMVKYRFSYLGVVDYYPKSKDKIKDLEHFKAIYNLKDEEILSMGDDIPDREMLKQSHIAACPPNAVPEIKKIADYISPIKGGSGAVCDVIEQVLKAQGHWDVTDETSSI